MVTTRGATSAAIAQFEHDAKNWNLLPDDFILLDLLGQGGEGSVYHATHKASGLDVALKRIPFTGLWDNEQESRIHIQLQHPNILRMFGMFRDDDDVNDSDFDSDYDSDEEDYDENNPPSSCWMILEYCREGTMQQVMETSGFSSGSIKAKEAFVGKALHAILRAIQYMHGAPHHLMHRDIKPQNLLYKEGEPLLADFGMCASLKTTLLPPSESTQADEHGLGGGGVAGVGTGVGFCTDAAGRNHEFVGTIIYMAPEVLAMDQKYRASKKKTTAAQRQQHNGGGEGGGGVDDNKVKAGQEVEDDEEWRKGYSYEADAWSLGVTTYELLMGKHPFPIHDEQMYTVEMCRHVDNNFAPCDIDFPTDDDKNSVSPEAQHFILSLVQVDPKTRMSIDEALRHPWILRHGIKQQHNAATATAAANTTTSMSNQGKENKLVMPQQQRAAKNKQILASKNIVNNNNDDDATVKQPAASMSNPENENKPVIKLQHGAPPAKSKQIIDSSGGVEYNNNDNDIAVQQVRAVFGGLNINQHV